MAGLDRHREAGGDLDHAGNTVKPVRSMTYAPWAGSVRARRATLFWPRATADRNAVAVIGKSY